MELNKQTLIDHLGQMTVMEMANLVRELEDTWGVSATPQQSWKDQFAPPDMFAEEQTEFDVLMTSYGEKKIMVIKALRSLLPGLGLKEAKLMAESAPGGLVKEGVSKEEAENFKVELEKAGASIEIK